MAFIRSAANFESIIKLLRSLGQNEIRELTAQINELVIVSRRASGRRKFETKCRSRYGKNSKTSTLLRQSKVLQDSNNH